ncbi:DUF3696 domain-containing protein [Blastopirellula sp. JC732]|uniref:DUF3696 domain-containing protein n=1 Tax=Blastopirellula sediminis TaxID=2894196 RepID=A0A9X1MMK2_9BACT|nr:DUF3696 domain-containing protein [Blastopirellula sediminis]MCC9608566.1 DUF3696 domain-containing protein [Blastopirellula sediminis]MCC9628657.1 DUF3696 domain-containing protein [Blastopirellula sediminis]
MITELSATNFKSWSRINRMRLSSITGLFGTNSSGKSSILQLLLMLRQTTESTDRALVLEVGGEKSLVQLGSFNDLVYQHQPSSGMEFELTWTLPKALDVINPSKKKAVLFSGDQMSLNCKLSSTRENLPRVDSVTYTLDSEEFTMEKKGVANGKYNLKSKGDFKLKRMQGRAWDLPAPTKFYGFPDQVFSYYQNASFLADLQLEFEELFKRLYYLGPLREFPKRAYTWSGAEPDDMGQRGERAVDALLSSRARGPYIDPGRYKKKKTLEEQVAYWLKELGLIHSFSVKRISKNSNFYEVKVRKGPKSAEVSITDVGFGVSQILPVLVLCYYVPEGSVVVLEQPEIHLHPMVQTGLADVFINAIQTRNIQIILESHSEHLLRRLQRRIAEETLSSQDVALYFCDTDEGHSRLSRLELDIFGNIKNWPKDFFGDEFEEMKAITDAAMKRRLKEMP